MPLTCNEVLTRRVLLVADEGERAAWRALFSHPALASWLLDESSSPEQARFTQQVAGCDVVLVDGLASAGSAALSWLAGSGGAPVLLLSDGAAEQIEEALRLGAALWLPRGLVLTHPSLLGTALQQLARRSEQQARLQQAERALGGCHDRLAHLRQLLWEAAPVLGQGPGRWYTQRYMLERLDEEVARTQRHGGPLTVVLGELAPARELEAGEARALASWTAEQVGRSKRRCDVAGRYGLQGFMLLLPRAGAREAALACARLRQLLEHPPEVTPAMLPLRACFGIASAADTPAHVSVQGLLSRAEERLERECERGEGADEQAGPAR